MTNFTIIPMPKDKAPKYKKGTGNLALVASDGTQFEVLDKIGAALEYTLDDCGVTPEEFFGEVPAGFWIWEGTLDSDGFANGDLRLMSAEEWAKYKYDGCPWDSQEWFEDASTTG